MFCAALTRAPVTMCTLRLEAHAGHAERLADAFLASMMNSCGRMCRIFWSAGIATACAASITRSTSPGVTSLSRIATMPCELQAADVAAGDAGVDRVDLAAGHQLGFLDRALDRLHGRLDVDDHAALQAARRVRADADDLDRPPRRDSPTMRDDLRRADVEADDQVSFSLSRHRGVASSLRRDARSAVRRVPADAKPLV